MEPTKPFTFAKNFALTDLDSTGKRIVIIAAEVPEGISIEDWNVFHQWVLSTEPKKIAEG